MNCLGKILFVILVVSLIYHEYMTLFIENIWDYLRQTRFVKLETCEPLLSVITFEFLINFYRILDNYCPTIHKYKLNYSPHHPIVIKKEKIFGFGYEFVKYNLYLSVCIVSEYILF